MLFFNDPVPCPEPALKAAQLSMDLRDAFVPLRANLQRRSYELDIGIGIALGFATLGIIGFEGRYDYTALGPTVIQASRLCTAAKGGEILAGPRAMAALDGWVEADVLDPIDAKGFAEPIRVWSLTKIAAPAGGAHVLAGVYGAVAPRTEFRILGPLEVVVNGMPIELAAGKERALLSRLVADANRVVSADQLLDDLWEGNPPDAAATSLRVHVSRVRKALAGAGADALIVTRAPGYVLETDQGGIDAARFEALVDQAKGGLVDSAPAEASATLRDALALWRGPALAEVAAAPNVGPEAQRLEELRLTALEDRIEADLRCGHHAALIGELQALVQAHPLRERVWGQLMLALYRTGRQAEALRAFQDLRAALADEVGLDPSPTLARLESAILTQDPSLDWSSAR
jgi:DNA-binding SARP family transcriptional activator